MGTPGDKTDIGEVVQGGDQLDPDRALVPPTTTAGSLDVTLLSQAITTSPPPDMGVLSRLPQFDTIARNIQPSISSPAAAAKADPFLEQAHMEDYFTQTKYYPTVSENVQSPEPEAGPSGIQPAKAKGAPKPGRRAKKGAQLQKKAYFCSMCQRGFESTDKMLKHQQSHSSPFKCEHCKKTFSSKFKLVRHALIHSDRKPFSCSVCERTFHRKDHLKNHVKVHSPSKKIYLCEKSDCKKEYTSLMSYRKHLALHAAEAGSLECQICSSVFSTKEEILYHLKIHAGSRTVKNPNEKKFTCDVCGRKFFTKKDVRRHLVVHTGMRDFLCQFCPQRFGRKDHLVRHIKKSHSKNVPPEELETAIKSEAPDAPVKSEPELSESSLSNTEFNFSLEDILQPEALRPFLEPDEEGNLPFLPQEELKDLGSSILEGIADSAIIDDPEILAEDVLKNADLLMVQPSEMHTPLPGFSQTFQPPPPP